MMEERPTPLRAPGHHAHAGKLCRGRAVITPPPEGSPERPRHPHVNPSRRGKTRRRSCSSSTWQPNWGELAGVDRRGINHVLAKYGKPTVAT